MPRPTDDSLNKPIHSDFLIHWTGDDIDAKYNPQKQGGKWQNEVSSRTVPEEIEEYLERLKFTLKYGLWMTERRGPPGFIRVNNQEFEKPRIPRTSFTELRLSDARLHASRFGRLGIGFKRYYLFNRLGSPMLYVQEGTNNLFFPPYNDGLTGKNILSFAKHMCRDGETPKRYTHFEESEWRIIYSEAIKDQLVAPSNYDPDFVKYLQKVDVDRHPKYLMPLDFWFAMIIYPSLAIKVEAESDPEIRELIEKLKPKQPENRHAHSNASDEGHSKPVEIDLDACRNF